MKFILLVLFASIQVLALNIYLNSAKEDKSPYAILHIIDDEPVSCKSIPQPLDKKDYLCEFNKTIESKIQSKRLKLVDIDFIQKKDRFFIKIVPKVSSNIIALEKPLYESKNVQTINSHKKQAKHWVILLYTTPPFGKREAYEGINFPITYTNFLMPHIGPVDLNGAPISYVAGDDINDYLDIQKEYRKGDYENTIRDVDRTLGKYPSTIFKSDLLLYKIKALDKLLENGAENYNNTDLSKLAKSWIREFSSNENIPEVLFLLVKDYLRIGSNTDVKYFLDILISEHHDNSYTKRAILHFADYLYGKGKKDKAIKLYKDVLYSTKDLDIASKAAIRLTSSNIDEGKHQEARDYLAKVLDANKKYLLKNKIATQQLAEKLAANGMPGMAAKLSDLLLESMGKGANAQRELLLKESGDWHAKSGDIKKAYARYEEYKKRYKEGDYIDEVNRSLDELFFETDEKNETKLLNYYDRLISKYDNYIRDKAVIRKARLLLKNKRYKDVLDMKDMLDKVIGNDSNSTDKFIQDAGYSLIQNDLQEQKCNEAVMLLEKYGLKQEKIKSKADLFSCLMITSRYEKAAQLANKESDSDDLQAKFRWLQDLVNARSKMQKYDSAISVEADLFSLSKVLKRPMKFETIVSLFDARYYMKQYDKALELLNIMAKRWPNNINNIEPYYKIVLYASNKRDDLLLINYAKKIMNIQEKNKLFLHSPNIEFLLIDALKRISKPQEALSVAKSLEERKLDDNAQARVMYELGELSIKLNDDTKAKEYFDKCTKIKKDSSWKSLCIESLKLF